MAIYTPCIRLRPLTKLVVESQRIPPGQQSFSSVIAAATVNRTLALRVSYYAYPMRLARDAAAAKSGFIPAWQALGTLYFEGRGTLRYELLY